MKERANSRFYSLVLSALFAAIISVISQISVITPIGIPLTFQIFAIGICGYLLGVKWGICSVLVYIILGSVGLPVFSGFKGGIQCLFELTGGFIIGFLFLVLFCGFGSEKERIWIKIFLGLSGLILCNLWGIMQFFIISGGLSVEVLVTVFLPYFIKDTILLCMAAILGNYLKKRITKYAKK